MLALCSQCTAILLFLILTCEQHCKTLPWTYRRLASGSVRIGFSIIYTVSQIDADVTGPGQNTLVDDCKYWHSTPLVSFLTTATLYPYESLWESSHSTVLQ